MKKILIWLLATFFVAQVSAQTITVSGTVLDPDGAALPGASVVEKGSSNGTMTDANGKYSISVNQDATLVISFIGMKTKEVAVEGKSVIDVTLELDAIGLETVVAIGYGVQKKSDVTGAISSVSSEDLESQSVTNAASLLQGRASGVQITNTSGEPGAGISVRIRGTGTVGDASPLYVVDGILLESISHINPNDIENVEVLKDASSTAIYGSRGANGVVLITTKTGKTEKIKVVVDAMHTFQTAWKTPDFVNSQDWLYLFNTAQANAAAHTGTSTYPQLTLTAPSDDPTHTTDWFDAVTRTGAIDKTNVTISQGTEKSNTFFSVGYLNNRGIVEYSKYERINARLKTNYKISDMFRTGVNISLSSSDFNDISGSSVNGVLTLAQRLDPLTPYKDNETGEFLSTPYSDLRNPVAIVNRDIYENSALLILANTYLEAEIIDGLVFKTALSTNISHSSSKDYLPKYQYVGGESNLTNSLTKGTSEYFGWLSDNTITYSKVFGDHSLVLLAGFTAEQEVSEYLSANRKNIPNDLEEMQYISASSDLESTNAWNSGVDIRRYSYLGRVNYNYADKYFLTATIRRDGSSVFGPGMRFGTFPSANLGWKLRNESFMDFLPEDIVSRIKIRAGWGRVGNANIAPYGFTSTMQTGDSRVEYSYVFGDQEYAGAAPVKMANESIHWETVESTNFGIDLGFLNDKLSVTADYFVKNTKEMLVQVPIPTYAGYDGNPYSNVGEVQNKGIEFEAIYRGKIGSEIDFSISANVSHIKNEVISLGGGQPIWGGSATLIGSSTHTSEGYPIGAFWGYELEGVFTSYEEVAESAQAGEGIGPGDFKFVDQPTDNNGDDIIDGPDGVIDGDDRTMIGSPIPDIFYGFNFDVTYKGFDLTMFFQGVYGNELFNAFKYYNYDVNKKYAFHSDYLNHWPENRTGKMFGLNSATVVKNLRVSDFYIEDGSYLRLKNVQLGYTFKDVTPWLERARIYFSGQNVFTITNYSGLDPEIGGGTLSQGVDYGTYPQARSLSFGATLTF